MTPEEKLRLSKEGAELSRFYKDPKFSQYFPAGLAAENFDSSLNRCVQFKERWKNPTFRSQLELQVPGIKTKEGEVIYPARCYSVTKELGEKKGVKFSDQKNYEDFIGKCRPDMAAREGSPVKKDQVSPYFLLPSSCGQFLTPLVSQMRDHVPRDLLAQAEEKVPGVVHAPKSSPLQELAQTCREDMAKGSYGTPCKTLMYFLKEGVDNRQLAPHMYGKQYQFYKINPTVPLRDAMNMCAKSELEARVTSKDTEEDDWVDIDLEDETKVEKKCIGTMNTVLSAWEKVDPTFQENLIPTPARWLQEKSSVLASIVNKNELDQQVMYFSYDDYKTSEGAFMSMYSMACALDPSYRLRLAQKDKTLIEQELAGSNARIAKYFKAGAGKFSEAVREKFGEAGEGVANRIDVDEQDREFLRPVSVGAFVHDFDALEKIKTTDESIAGVRLNVAEILSGARAVTPGRIPDGIKFKINMNAIYAVLSKICISILGPDYLDAEEKIRELAAKDPTEFQKKLGEISDDFSSPSNKASAAYANLPTNEYNKLRQVALSVLTNIHLLLVEAHLREHNDGKINQFSLVADELKSALGEQLKFLTEYFYGIHDDDLDALGLPFIGDDYAEAFLDPIFPQNLDKVAVDRAFSGPLPQDVERPTVDRSTLLSGRGDNIYSLYANFLLASTEGFYKEENVKKVNFDNRDLKGRLVGSVKRMYGGDIERAVQAGAKAAIGLALNLLPIPAPPAITGGIATGLSMVLTKGPLMIMGAVRDSCRFNKDKCPKDYVDQIGLERTLLVRVTEFLTSLGRSMNDLTEATEEGKDFYDEKNRKYSRMMPTLYMLESKILADEKQAKIRNVSNFEDMIQKMKERTADYYGMLEDLVGTTEGISKMMTDDSLSKILAELEEDDKSAEPSPVLENDPLVRQSRKRGRDLDDDGPMPPSPHRPMEAPLEKSNSGTNKSKRDIILEDNDL
ncbi:hypothetical protein OAN22_02410 [Alphaproteobacteria bacterium]|nr:hypothetical protein [Alphaproteobacteria bacterium]